MHEKKQAKRHLCQDGYPLPDRKPDKRGLIQQYCSIFKHGMKQNSSIAFFKKELMLLCFSAVKDLRIDADKTQADIAQVLSCNREVYRRYEKANTSFLSGH